MGGPTSMDPGVEQAIRAIASAASARVNWLACNLDSTEQGKVWLQHWGQETKTNFAGATEIIRSDQAVAETENTDVYFNTNMLNQWGFALGRRQGEAAKKDASRKGKCPKCGAP